MVVDVVTYNGERDLFDIRYNVLRGFVDEFIVVEFDKTFSGEHKPPQFPISQYPEVRHHYIGEELYEKYRELAESSPNTVGASHWTREFMQKESIKDALTHLNDDDVVFVGDVDEIWRPSARYLAIYKGGMKLPLVVYTYYLNNRSTEIFWGTYVGYYREIKDTCLNHLRSDSYRFNPNFEEHDSNYCGWHFTSMGGAENLKKKLTDSYTQESYATPEVLAGIEYNIQHGRDFLGRDFTYKIDESAWPQYLKDNREKYQHLLRKDAHGNESIGKETQTGSEQTAENSLNDTDKETPTP